MRKDLTSKLYLRFPDIFKGHKKPVTESLMAFGLECGDGWFQLIFELCEALEKQSDLEGVEMPEARQIKEKFGGLRIYVSGTTKSMLDIIDRAEDKSETICEICGETGKVYKTRGWMKTRCLKHQDI